MHLLTLLAHAATFDYTPIDADGHVLIDTLFVVTPQAVAEIEAGGSTPESLLLPKLEAVNATLARSRVDNVRVRALGVHRLVEADFARVGVWPGVPETSMVHALDWLGGYRETYGADKIIVVAGTGEGQADAALGGGDLSAHWVDFLPIEHELGHQMGLGHCFEGSTGSGMPVGGYTGDGQVATAGLGGTRMCGNSLPFYSNPDLVLTKEGFSDLLEAGLIDGWDPKRTFEADGVIRLGHPEYANAAKHWREEGPSHADRMPTAMDPRGDRPWDRADCVGLFADDDYGEPLGEVCVGETWTGDVPVRSVRLGRDVHATVRGLDEGLCGGSESRIGFSSPSLAALAEHRGHPAFDAWTVDVYATHDRAAFERADGPFRFVGTNALPRCEGDVLTVMPDHRDWSSTAAVTTHRLSGPFEARFQLRTAHEGDEPPADGIAVLFGQDPAAWDAPLAAGGGEGLERAPTGYALMFDGWNGRIALRGPDGQPLGEDRSFDTFTRGDWVDVAVRVGPAGTEVWWDGVRVHRTRETLAVDGAFGFAAHTGFYTSAFQVREVRILPWTPDSGA
ncbi:MAG: hypothetical protein H6737_21490 [Alphaproteobacteria bacterium]|nr:hypothetical protein [Alphaproteobacteria bacterium]